MDETIDPIAEPDPAERSALNRLFYRNRRPTWLGHWVSQLFCWGARVGVTPRSWVSLEVRDRASGRMRADAVEAAHGDAVVYHGRPVRVRLVPVPPENRAPILREYVRVASSGRKHFPLPVGAPLADFAAIAAEYPVYRIELSPGG
jgi:hypothetical protein